jgi:hypothetical protein
MIFASILQLRSEVMLPLQNAQYSRKNGDGPISSRKKGRCECTRELINMTHITYVPSLITLMNGQSA